MAATMRADLALDWLARQLWMVTVAAIGILAIGFVLPYRTSMPLEYLRLSRTGRLTTATIEGSEGYVRPKVVYSYTTADGVRRQGRSPSLRAAPGEEVLVLYLPGEPDVSVPLNEWFEFEQLATAVLAALACVTSLVAWRVRARRVTP